MAQLGNIESMYGNNFSIAVANTEGSNILSASELPGATIIISAPQNAAKQDIGNHALFVTDAEGIPVRLTYSISSSNGLTNDNGKLFLAVDNNTITTNGSGLTVNLDNIVDSKTILVNASSILTANTSGLSQAYGSQRGIAKIDGDTIKEVDNTLYVETTALQKADDLANTSGIVIGDGETIKTENGIISVITSGLSNANGSRFGVTKIDNKTIRSANGALYVVTGQLDKASETTYGITAPDKNSVIINGSSISINTAALQKASSSAFGIATINKDSFILNQNGAISVLNYSLIENSIKSAKQRIDNLIKNTTIVSTANDKISVFKCQHTTTKVITPPEYGDDPIYMPVQHVNISATINTNCPYKLRLEYEQNEPPSVELLEINYNDTIKYEGVTGLDNVTYPSTNSVDKTIKFLLNTKNFFNINEAYSKTTHIKISAISTTNNNIYKSFYFSVVRFNSGYKETVVKAINSELEYYADEEIDNALLEENSTFYLDYGLSTHNDNEGKAIATLSDYEKLDNTKYTGSNSGAITAASRSK